MGSRLLFHLLCLAILVFCSTSAEAKVLRVYTGKLNMNTASAADLARLPGIGEVIAFRIVKERERVGRFRDTGELKAVKGISPRVYEGLRSYLSLDGDNTLKVRIDLNSITKSLLLGLPGMTEGEARSILTYRKSKSRFAGVEELRFVPGVTDKRRLELAEWLTVAR